MMFAHDATSFYILRSCWAPPKRASFQASSITSRAGSGARAGAHHGSFMTAVVTAGIVAGALLSMDGQGGLAGWQWMFLLEGIPAAVLGFVVLRVLDETPADARWLTDPEKSALLSRLQQESAPAAGRADGVSDALRHPWIWVLALVYFVVPVALYGFGFFLPQILRSTFAGTPFQIGVLSAIPYFAGAAGMIVTSRHSDRTGERRWHVAVAPRLPAWRSWPRPSSRGWPPRSCCSPRHARPRLDVRPVLDARHVLRAGPRRGRWHRAHQFGGERRRLRRPVRHRLPPRHDQRILGRPDGHRRGRVRRRSPGTARPDRSRRRADPALAMRQRVCYREESRVSLPWSTSCPSFVCPLLSSWP